MIKRVKIQGYKSLTDVEFEPKPLTVLIGPNAAGKSNVLDALQLLSRIAQVQTLKDAFEPPYRGSPLESFSFGTGGIQGLLKKERASFSIEVDFELSDNVVEEVNREIRDMRRMRSDSDEEDTDVGNRNRAIEVKETYLRYRVEIEIQPRTGILSVADEYLAALRQDGEPTKSRKPFLELKEGRLRLRLEGQGHPHYLDPHLDQSVVSMPLFAPHYPHMAAVRKELSRWFFYYFEPRERMRTPSPVKEVRHIGPMGEELASFLNTLKATQPRQFKAIEKSLRMVIPSITGLEVEINKLGQVELGVREGDVPLPARLVSEGTLRILGLLTLSGVQEPASLLGFEEPENGVHPRRIEHVARYLETQAQQAQSQFVITTHSLLLSDRLPYDSLHLVKKDNGQTSIRPLLDESGPLFANKNRIEKALNDVEVEERKVSDLILRGDFDA
jgi:predicted ATPase